MRHHHCITAAMLLTLTACTSVTVKPVDKSISLRSVCIQENAKVQVSDFVQVVRDGLSRHGVASEFFSGQKPEKCEYVLTYTALRSWDFSPYLSHAELRIEKDNRQIAFAEYHLNGKGGLSLTKWASTRDKMDPVIDELLRK